MIKQSLLKKEMDIYLYQNQPSQPRFGVFIIHGMAEHGLRYQGFMASLEKENILAITMDLRGHGQSLRPFQKVGILDARDHFDVILEDIYDAIKTAQNDYPAVTFTLMGHSMGSIFARAFALKYKGTVETMIWMGTLPYFSPLKITFIRLIAGVFSLLYPPSKRNQILSFLLNHPLEKKHSGRAFNWLSKNPQNVDDYTQDELSGYPYNSRFYRWFFKLIRDVNKKESFEASLLSSVFIIAGTQDPVIGSPQKLKALMGRYQGVKVAYYFVPQARHEVLHEEIWAVDQWLCEVITHER